MEKKEIITMLAKGATNLALGFLVGRAMIDVITEPVLKNEVEDLLKSFDNYDYYALELESESGGNYAIGDKKGNVIGKSCCNGTTVYYKYDDNGCLKYTVSPNGNITKFETKEKFGTSTENSFRDLALDDRIKSFKSDDGRYFVYYKDGDIKITQGENGINVYIRKFDKNGKLETDIQYQIVGISEEDFFDDELKVEFSDTEKRYIEQESGGLVP